MADWLLRSESDCSTLVRVNSMSLDTLSRFVSSTTITFALLTSPMQGQSASTESDEAVLIVHNLCTGGAPAAKASDGPCNTVIRKADFDNLIVALDPNMPASDRLVLATQYVKLLVLGHEAERRKLDQQ